MQAILKEYDVAIGKVIPVPPGWEGNPPLQAITHLADLDDWLKDQWNSTRATEMGGDSYKTAALEQAARAVRNGFRALKWLGMDERPERPLPADTLDLAKQQLDDLERWVHQKLKDGWTPPEPRQPDNAEVTPATTIKRRKRTEYPDEYEVNVRINQYLAQHPSDSIRRVAEAVELSVGKVQQTDAWRREMARRRTTKKPAKKEARPLTRRMLASIGKEDNINDIDGRIDAEDAIWRRIMEEADDEKRIELHLMNADQRRRLIEAATEHYADRLTEESD